MFEEVATEERLGPRGLLLEITSSSYIAEDVLLRAREGRSAEGEDDENDGEEPLETTETEGTSDKEEAVKEVFEREREPGEWIGWGSSVEEEERAGGSVMD